MSCNRLLTLYNHIGRSSLVRMKALNTYSTFSPKCQQNLLNGGRLMSTNIKKEVIDDSSLSNQSSDFSFEVPEIPTSVQVETEIITENMLKASDIGLNPFLPTSNN